MSIRIPLTNEILEQIQKQYAHLIAEDVKRINDPANLSNVPKIVSEIQEKLNDYARHLYDKHGRIVIRVGPGDFDYLDITGPRIHISQTKATINFLETDAKGHPAVDPSEIPG